MAAIMELVGESVIDGKGNEVSVKEICKDKTVIGIYFSASWCPPCRSFTPVLSRFHKANDKDLVVIFVSSDIDQASFDEYFGEMPWYAVPYSSSNKKEQLREKYASRGIPNLVVLRPNGEIIEANGRRTVQEAAQNNIFPEKWK
ncbi:uncharacterized protein LOC123560570 [Mercenaria mercenaria]|uniref:uncharacterized protein LOC123560570 n=1 Tax=Mercenaria mercenaria TaxID=6596 RepID=UPI00234E5728|nr:uncharacterized protein LOC123560570 [Mercenaria mercenaria]